MVKITNRISDFVKNLAYFDDELHSSELLEEQRNVFWGKLVLASANTTEILTTMDPLFYCFP
jgi:hypothetical protein